MRKINQVLIVCVLMIACSSKKEPPVALSDSTSLASDSASTTAQKEVLLGPDLDLEHFTVYDYTDTINFKDLALPVDNDSVEHENIKADPRVKRTAEGLQFQLANGQLKILKDNKEDGEGYVEHSFIKSWNDMEQWQVLSVYYEEFNYWLIDQNDGTGSVIWGTPVFSPDKKYFLTSSVDIEAAFNPNGFQMWTFKDKKPSLLWTKELTDWGADNLIWRDNNYIIGEQTYRDTTLNQTSKRIIKIPIHWPK